MSDSNILKPEEYLGKAYINKQRWVSYSLQIKLINDLKINGEILEIGLGNGITADYLRKKYKLTTVDINSGLNPDLVASVEDLGLLGAGRFDASACFEVLEHLPFEKFGRCLSELSRISRRYVVISLPYWGYTFGCRCKLPVIGEHALKFKISGLRKHRFSGQHYWEIGKRGYPLSRIKKAIAATGLKVQNSFWDIDDPYHYYFILKK